MEFVYIKPGTFPMGTEDNRIKTKDEKQHIVQITSGFWLGTTEITYNNWCQIQNCSVDDNKKNLPVTNVTINEINKYIDVLSLLDKKNMYRLPTEAEWEYACRAGTQSIFYNGDNSSGKKLGDNFYCFTNDLANIFAEDTDEYFCPKKVENKNQVVAVKSYKPNEWGLFDMYGNVRELCYDYYVDYSEKKEIDPIVNDKTKYRVVRGGSFKTTYKKARSAARDYIQVSGFSINPIRGFRSKKSWDDVGFRLVREEKK